MTALSASDFGQLISDSKASIVRDFIATATARVPAARTITSTEVEDHMDRVISELALFMKGDGNASEFVRSAWLADRHGLQRAQIDAYTLEDVQTEYLILRRILFEIIPEGKVLDDRASELFSEILLLTSNKGTENFVRNSVAELLDHKRRHEASAQEIQALSKSSHNVQDALVRLKTTLNQMPIGVALFEGPEHVYAFTNPTFARLLGGQLVNAKTVREVAPNIDVQDLIHIMDDVYRTGKPYSTGALKTSQNCYLKVSIQPLQTLMSETHGVSLTVVDVTELTRARQLADETSERASKAERLLQKAVDVAQIGFFDWDMQKDEFKVSDQFTRDFGLASGVSIEEIVEVVMPEDREPLQRMIDQAIASGEHARVEYRIQRKTDGALIWIEAQGRVTLDDHGRAQKMFGTTRNITERKLLESEMLAMVNSIPQLAWMADSEGHLFWYNQRWQDFTGADQREMRKVGWAPFHHPSQLERASKKWFEHLRTGEAWEDVFPLRGKDGEFRTFLSRAIPIRDFQGKIVRWFGTNTDITDTVNTEQNFTRLAAVVESSGDFISMSDADLNPIFVNTAGREMTGFGDRDITKAKIVEFFCEGDRSRVENEVIPTLLREGFWEGELRFRHFETDEEIPVIYNLFPIKDAKSAEILGYATVTRDITDRKRMERKILAAKEDAEHANHAKSAFLANMSHEIRTPIGAIMGFSDLARQPETNPKDVRNYLSIVERNSVQVLRIIDDILDLAKVEAGRIDLERIEFSFPEFLADFSSLMGFRARENGIRLKLLADSDLPNTIVSDPTRLRQILTNAVGNAIKFTTKGAVTLHVAVVRHSLIFRIADTGRGISEEQSKNLFQAFVQADVSTTRKFGGTGLGLVLTKRLCQVMGGDYSLESSEIDKGSTFKAVVEVGLSENAEMIPRDEVAFESRPDLPTKVPEGTLDRIKILLVEDSPDNQELIKLILERQGARVSIAPDGFQGVQLAVAGDFDVVLMDIQMPIMDGHEAVQKLRTGGYTKPIIALTAHAMREEIDRARRSGFSGYLSKPVHRESLVSTVREFGPHPSH